MRPEATQHPQRPRHGLTLAEVIVALTIVAIGLLGIAGSSALSLRRTAADGEARHAIERVRLRIALLESAGCRMAADGSADDSASGRTEHWHVGPPSGAMMPLDDSVSWRAEGRMHTVAIQSALLC